MAITAPSPGGSYLRDDGRAGQATIRRRVSPAARMSRLTATVTDRLNGNDVKIGDVDGRGLLHMPTTSRSDDFDGVMLTKLATHLWLEFSRNAFPYVSRGTTVFVDGQQYRAAADQEPLLSEVGQGNTGRLADGEVTMVWLDDLRRPIT